MSSSGDFKAPQQVEKCSAMNAVNNHPRVRRLACLRCQQRKVKCDRKEPCSRCVKSHLECKSMTSTPTRRRKKRFSEAELLANLRRYEVLLKDFGVDVNAFNNEAGGIPAIGTGENSRTDNGNVWTISKEESSMHERSWADSKNEFQDTEEVLQGSSDDELSEEPFKATWESTGDNDPAALLVGAQPRHAVLTSLYPRPMDIMRLWQMFVDNVHPLSKIIHAPTIQQQILEASANPSEVSKGMEALFFSIFAIAVISVDEARCKEIFGERQSTLLKRYQFGAQQALLNAEFLKPSTLTVIQALLLYLFSLRQGVDPRSTSCLSGIVLRLAQQLGLHRDNHDIKLPPFEIEMRRRVWWQIVLFETRIAEYSGIGTSVITTQWTTRLPSNVNDSDLYPGMNEPPVEHDGVTDMVFCMIRYEVNDFLRRVRTSSSFDGSWHELSTSKLPLSAKDKAINELEELVEGKYLKYCDVSIPLHFLAVATTKGIFCKLRHYVYHPRLLPDRGASLSQSEKDRFFSWSVSMVEYNNNLNSDSRTQGFAWYTSINSPLEAYIYLLRDLRFRTVGDLADRAWEQVLETLHYWIIVKGVDERRKHSALFVGISNLVVKAWDARANALSQGQPLIPTPECVRHLQEVLEISRMMKAEKANSERFLDYSTWGLSSSVRIGYPDQPQIGDVGGNSEVPLTVAPINDPIDWVYWNEVSHGLLLPNNES